MSEQYRRTGTKPMHYTSAGWVESHEQAHVQKDSGISWKFIGFVGVALLALYFLSGCTTNSDGATQALPLPLQIIVGAVVLIMVVCFFGALLPKRS